MKGLKGYKGRNNNYDNSQGDLNFSRSVPTRLSGYDGDSPIGRYYFSVHHFVSYLRVY